MPLDTTRYTACPGCRLHFPDRADERTVRLYNDGDAAEMVCVKAVDTLVVTEPKELGFRHGNYRRQAGQRSHQRRGLPDETRYRA